MKKVVGIAFTAKQREQKALQATVEETGIDPRELTFVPDKRSKTAKVVTSDGSVKGRFSW